MAALPRAQHRRGRAAGALGIRRLLVDPEPQREADDIAAAGALAQQRDGGIDAARHRDGDPAARVRERERSLGRVAERRVQGVERHRGALTGVAGEPELLGAVGERRARGVQESAAPGCGGRPRPRRRSRARRLPHRSARRRSSRPAPSASVMRTRSPQALPPAKPSPSGSGTRPASSKSSCRSIRRPRSRAAAARAQRTTAPAASTPCPSSLSAPKLRRSAPRAWSAVTPIAVSAGLALDSALAQAGPAAAATPCSSSSETSAWPFRPSISASECPGVRSARSPTIVTPGTSAISAAS